MQQTLNNQELIILQLKLDPTFIPLFNSFPQFLMHFQVPIANQQGKRVINVFT